MGVSWVFPLPEAAGRSGPQAIESFKRHLELLGARRASSSGGGQFFVDSEPYYPKQELGLKTIHLCHTSEFPATTFALVSESPGACPSLTADTMFDQLMAKLSNVYNTKHQAKIECRGPKYELGDFLIKIGAVTIGAVFKGVVMEVEYGPCQVPSLCNELMKEFCDGLLSSAATAAAASAASGPTSTAGGGSIDPMVIGGVTTTNANAGGTNFVATVPNYIQNHFSKPAGGGEPPFRPIDAINQYMELFHQFRRVVSGPRP